MKKCGILCLAAVLCLSSLTGCTSFGAPEQTNKSLTVSVGPYMDIYLDTAVTSYKTLYPDVELIVEDHSGDTDIDLQNAYWENTRTSLMAGRGPDVVFNVESLFPDPMKTVSAGVFAPLDEFIRQDEEFAAGAFYETVLQAGQYQGRQYLIPFTWNVPLLLTSEEALREADFDRATCTDFFGLMGELDRCGSAGTMPMFSDLRYPNFMNFLGVPVYNYEGKTVELSSPLLKQAADAYGPVYLREFSGELNKNYSTSIDGGKAILERQSLFTLYGLYEGVGDPVLQNASVVQSRETPVLIPVRNVRGGIQATPQRSVGIRNNSNNQQNAWNFIKVMLSAAVQDYRTTLYDLPVRRESLDTLLERAQQSYRDNPSAYPEWGYGTGRLTPEFYEQYRSLLAEADSASMPDTSYFLGRLESYYRGEESYEDSLAKEKENMERYISE